MSFIREAEESLQIGKTPGPRGGNLSNRERIDRLRAVHNTAILGVIKQGPRLRLMTEMEYCFNPEEKCRTKIDG